MISRLPHWVEYGAFLLAALAGSINAVALLGFQQQAVSHLSGTATQLGAALLGWDIGVGHLSMVLGSFLLGSAISGFMIEGTALRLGRNYGYALALEGALLVVAMLLLSEGWVCGHYFASAACGLQNALATTYSGAVVRTTHVTGIFTDLGIMLGAHLRGKPLDRRKGILFLLIIAGFISGGVVGSGLFLQLHFMALLYPALAAFCLAVVYGLYSYFLQDTDD